MKANMQVYDLMYFPPTAFWSQWKKHGSLLIESADNYQKTSYRNRAHIAHPEGFVPMGIPLLKGKNSRMPYQKVLVDNTKPWQRNHWRAITTAYGKSPFFEHYSEQLKPLFERKWTHLFDYNLEALLLVKNLLAFDDYSFELTDAYDKYPESEDFRSFIKPNRDINHKFVEYVQVFSDKTGFVPNLSILDLLFCMGPEAQRFL